MKQKRVDTNPEKETLTHNPFAALAGASTNAAPAPEPPAQASTRRPFSVQKTRKGGWHTSIEKRGGGKVVTVLLGVTGDREALLKDLKKYCGAGGTVREGGIELQGDHRAKLEAWLSQLK